MCQVLDDGWEVLVLWRSELGKREAREVCGPAPGKQDRQEGCPKDVAFS